MHTAGLILVFPSLVFLLFAVRLIGERSSRFRKATASKVLKIIALMAAYIITGFAALCLMKGRNLCDGLSELRGFLIR